MSPLKLSGIISMISSCYKIILINSLTNRATLGLDVDAAPFMFTAKSFDTNN